MTSDPERSEIDRVPRAMIGGPFAYFAMVAAAFGLFLLIDHIGGGVIASASAATVGAVPAADGKANILVHVLITLIAVVVAGQVFGRLFRLIGQPPVIGEVIAGIALGPSLLGRIWPEATQFLMPAEVGPFVGVIAQI